MEGHSLKSDAKSAEKALSFLRKHPRAMIWNDCTMAFWKGLRKHPLCKCCLLPTWPRIPVCGLNVNTDFDSEQLRPAGTQKWKSASPIHGSELCFTGRQILLLGPRLGPVGPAWMWRHSHTNQRPLFRTTCHSAVGAAGARVWDRSGFESRLCKLIQPLLILKNLQNGGFHACFKRFYLERK